MKIPEFLMNAKICNKETCEEIRTLKKENQRLNNVLNQLEKILIEDYKWLDEYGDALAGSAMGEIKRIEKKLNELKESDK